MPSVKQCKRYHYFLPWPYLHKKIRPSNSAESEIFSFTYISSDEIKYEFLNLDPNKTLREGDIPVYISNWQVFFLFSRKNALLIKKITGIWAYCHDSWSTVD